jgi:hypothetical protein
VIPEKISFSVMLLRALVNYEFRKKGGRGEIKNTSEIRNPGSEKKSKILHPGYGFGDTLRFFCGEKVSPRRQISHTKGFLNRQSKFVN